MQIVWNGQSCCLDSPSLVEALRARLGAAVPFDADPMPSGVAVAVNAVVIPRSQIAAYRLQPGDRVDVVQAVGGG